MTLCFSFPSAIASILRAWLDQCAEDFREPPDFPCLQKLLDYLKQMMPGSDPERRAQNLLEQFHKQEVETDSEYSFDSRAEVRSWSCKPPTTTTCSPYVLGWRPWFPSGQADGMGGPCKILKVIEVPIIDCIELENGMPLEKGMATHFSILAWRIPWTEEPGGSTSPWSHKVPDTTARLTL